MKIFGISGTNGSGKDTVAETLVEKHNFLFVSGSDLLRAELKKQGLEIERHNLRNLSAQWRREHGLGVITDKAVELYKTSKDKYQGLVIASIRNPGEADRIHELGGQIVWVDADPHVRYQRINSRGRGAEDQKTFEEFLAEEQAEMQHSGDEATLNMLGVKEKADIFLTNNGNDLTAFKDAAEKALGF